MDPSFMVENIETFRSEREFKIKKIKKVIFFLNDFAQDCLTRA